MALPIPKGWAGRHSSTEPIKFGQQGCAVPRRLLAQKSVSGRGRVPGWWRGLLPSELGCSVGSVGGGNSLDSGAGAGVHRGAGHTLSSSRSRSTLRSRAGISRICMSLTIMVKGIVKAEPKAPRGYGMLPLRFRYRCRPSAFATGPHGKGGMRAGHTPRRQVHGH